MSVATPRIPDNFAMPVADDTPLYSRVERVLADEIATGLVGDQLPTEDSLIPRFEVSRFTVRKAIQNLVDRGLVKIRRGRGTFVATPRVAQELTELTGFVEAGTASAPTTSFPITR